MTVTFTPPVTPSFPTKESFNEKILVNDFGDGYKARTPDGLRYKNTNLDLTWENLTDIEAQAIMDFFDARNGTLEPFLWLNPNGVTKQYVVTARDRTRTAYNVNTISAKFEEDRNGGV